MRTELVAAHAREPKKKSAAFYSSSEKQDWCTALADLKPVWDFAGPEGIGLDPCGHPLSNVNARQSFTGPKWGGLDGLIRSWRDSGLVYVNPPFGRKPLPKWARKVANEAAAGVEIVVLIPLNSDTEWWETLTGPAVAQCQWRGRMSFRDRNATGKKNGKATFSSVILYYGERVARFQKCFTPYGRIWVPADLVDLQ